MAFPQDDWEVATPESQGVDPEALENAVDYLRTHAPKDGVNELVIIRNGRLIWAGENIDNKHGVWSVTKSFTSTALGLLIDDGRVTLETRAAEYLPELAAVYPDVTLRHFTTMTSGYYAVGDEPRGSYSHGPSSTPFRPANTPLFTPPGSQYAYWDSAMNQFARVLTRAAEEPLVDLFERRIATPIGMHRDQWEWGDFGTVDGILLNGGAGNSNNHIQITARELARFGHLFLNRGNWNGQQLLSAEWVDAATQTHVPADTPLANRKLSNAPGPGYYGFNWWTNGTSSEGDLTTKPKWPGAPRDTYAASGFNNNDSFVIPSWRMVIVRMGLDEKERAITDKDYGRFLGMVGEAIVE